MLEDVASKSPESYFLSHLAQQGTEFENACEGELLSVLRMEDVRNDCPFLPNRKSSLVCTTERKECTHLLPALQKANSFAMISVCEMQL